MPAPAIIAILGLLPSLISMVEGLFGPGTGKVKKQVVIDIANTVVNTAAGLSTGGQKHTFEDLAPVIGGVIDSVAGLLFPSASAETHIEDQKPAEG